MIEHDLNVELERIINDLGKVDGVDGSLVLDGEGNILSQRILQDIDVELFSPMAHVITSSSKRLLNSSNQGKIQRVLVESEHGKAFFLHLGNVQFIVLMKNRANVGLVMVRSKRAAEKIVALTKDLEIAKVEEKVEIEEHVEVPAQKVEKQPQVIPEEIVREPLDVSKEVGESEPEKVSVTELKIVSEKVSDEQELISKTKIVDEKLDERGLGSESISSEVEPEKLDDVSEDLTVEEEQSGTSTTDEMSIPVIKPPIAFPVIKKVIEIPDDVEERADLILDIYEAIFRAMSIGASKIMGVAPARGLTQKFLPLEQCKKLLDGVNVQSNSTIDFNKIRENILKIPVEERESQFIEDFTKILDVVTENYGKVMGYGAFRGMVRPEFKIISDSYGSAMNKLGITSKMHPEMAELFE